PHAYMPMLQTAEIVAKRYGISREAQDEYSLQSQQRTAAAQAAGKFDQELAPMESVMAVVDKNTGEVSYKTVKLTKDDGNRPETTRQCLTRLKQRTEGGGLTGGAASQLSDGSCAAALM